jgi:hypothetical protein
MLAGLAPHSVHAHDSKGGEQVSWSETPAAVAVAGDLAPPPAGTSDIKFREFFKLPIGPRGLEPTAKLISLDGKRIRLLGYMVRQEKPAAGAFILAPLPVSVGEEDESLSDDLPASAVFVHLPVSKSMAVPYIPGLIRLTGELSVGPREEADGRVSAVRLQLDPEIAAAIAVTQEQLATSQKSLPQNR